MNSGTCGAERLNRNSARRTCRLEPGHPGNHQDRDGATWSDPGTTLTRLQDTYGSTHRIAYTGALWVAVHRDPNAPWRTEIEPTAEQLEKRLRTRQSEPAPQQRSHP